MSVQTKSNGSGKRKQRPLTKIIESEKEAIDRSGNDLNPNHAGETDERHQALYSIRQQLSSLQQQLDFLAGDEESGSDDEGAKAKSPNGAKGQTDKKVSRSNGSQGSDKAEDSQSSNDDSVTADGAGMLETARDAVDNFFDYEALKEQLGDLRSEVSDLTDRMSIDRSSARTFKDEVVAPAVSAALPFGLGKLGETAVKSASLETLARYGIPAAILVAAIKISSSSGGSSKSEG